MTTMESDHNHEDNNSNDNGVVIGPDLHPPVLDKKLYRQILLPNGLRCVLIEDVLAAPPTLGEDDDDDDDESISANSEKHITKHAHDHDEDCQNNDGEQEEEDDVHDEDDDEEDDGNDSGLRDAAVCIVVGAGSMYDPPECQGLAHFLEHLLFMGSQKYPMENEYDSFVSKRGGSDNAWTEWEHTSFSLEIPQDSLWGALDRLAQFFIAPLMLPSAVDRELKSIESEFLLHKNSDSVRWQELLCATCKATHPCATFSWGNRRSLKDIPALLNVDPLQQLWAFYNQYYYAANMRLVICSAYSLDTMQRKVLELFGKVPAMPRELGPYPLPVTLETIASWDAPPYASPMAVAGLPFEYGTESYHPMPRIYRIVPVRDRHVLHVTWCLPPVFDDWRSKSFDFIGHLIGHEANGSLLSYLKSKSWATQCMAGIGDSGSDRASSHSLFTLTIILSVDGLKEWKAVIDAIYEYIGMLRLQCRQGWPTYLFDELKTMHDLSYKYRDELPPDELVEGISDDMAPHVNMPPEHLLDGNSLLFEFDPVKVQMLIDEYMTPKQARIDLSSSTFGRASDFSDAALTEGVQTKPDIVLHAEEGTLDKDRIGAYNIEPMFGTIFWCSEVPEDWIQHWIALAEPHTPTIDIKLPLPNPFVPKRFDLKALPDHDSRHPLVNCSLKLCVPVGKKLQWFPATPVQYNKTRNSLLITYEDENEQWHVVDDSSDPAFKSLRVGHEGTLDKKQVKFRVLSVAHPGGCAPRMFGDETDLDVEDGKSFPPIPPSLSPGRLPQEVSNTNILKMWWLQDRQFHRPCADFKAQVVCAKANLCPLHRAAADLLVHLCVDFLTERSYFASLCELTYNIEATNTGFALAFAGYDDNILRMISIVFELVLSFRGRNNGLPDAFSEARFNSCLEVLERKYKNAGLTASKLCSNVRLQCFSPSSWSPNEKLLALSSINSTETFARTVSALWQDFAVEAFYHGNVDKSDALEARDLLLLSIGSGAKGLPRKKYPSQSVLRIPSVMTEPTLVRLPSLDPAEPNTAVEVYVQVGKDNLRERVLIDLLVHILNEPLYDQLRTKDQIGYDVHCDARWSFGIMGLIFHVVTNVKSADATVSRLMQFVREQRGELEKLTPSDFTEYVVGLAKQKLDMFNSLGEATNHYWSEIRDGSFQWQSRRDEAVCLQTITKEETLEAYDRWLGQRTAKQMFAVQVIGSGEGDVSSGRPEVEAGHDARDYVDGEIAKFREGCKHQTWGRVNSKLF